MVKSMIVILLIVAVVVLVWKMLTRRWSRAVYIRRDYDTFKRLDEQITNKGTDVEPEISQDHNHHALN